MHSIRTTASLILLAAVGWFVPLSGQTNLPQNTTTTNFVLPILTDGEKDMLIEGKRATSTGAFVVIEGARITLYRTSKRDSKITLFSPKVSYNMSKEAATSNERVNIRVAPAAGTDAQKGYTTVLDGVGFDLSNKKQVLGIRSNVRATIVPADTASTGEKTRVSAKELVYDVLHRKLVLSGDVRVVSEDSQNKHQSYSLHSDTLMIFSNPDGRPNNMTAEGNVRLSQSDDHATARKAVYRRLPTPDTAPIDPATNRKPPYLERFILSGNPVIRTESQLLQNADKVIIDQCGADRRFHTVGGKPDVILQKTSNSPTIVPWLGNPPTNQPEETGKN